MIRGVLQDLGGNNESVQEVVKNRYFSGKMAVL